MGISTREDFYRDILASEIISKNSSILICGGGLFDKSILESLGFNNVVISNLDERDSKDEFSPYKWDYQDAQNLTYGDSSFDYSIIHASVHHTSLPHKTVTELYRVARKSAFIFESRDSLLVRCLIKAGITEEYEISAVRYNDFKYGGVNNSQIPNFVFRWTEREILKTIKSFAPQLNHHIRFHYALALPAVFERPSNSSYKIRILKLLYTLLKPLILLATIFFKKQQNLFCINIVKSESKKNIKPWIKLDRLDGFAINIDWVNKNLKE